MRLSRRRLLIATGVSIAIAGCTGNGEDPEDDGETDPDSDDEGPTDDAPENGDEDGTGEDGDDEPEAETVVVAPDGEHRFDPDTLEIEPGTTVEFVWEGSGHNVTVTEQPEESDWAGVTDLGKEGDTHEHTFEVDGRYEYVCEPHAGDGMEGAVLVGEGGDADEPEDDDDDDGGY